MQIQNNSYLNKALSFKSGKIPKKVKLNIVQNVDKFIDETTINRGHKEVERYGSAVFYPMSVFFGVAGPIITKNFDWQNAAFLGFAAHLRNVCVTIHNSAVDNAVKFAKDMQQKGFEHQERLFGVREYLRKDGCPLFSTLFKIFNKEGLNKLADGENVTKSFPSYNSSSWKEKYNNRYFK